MYSF
ncbi:hypothetical protein F383_12874 [Gossypium arboreum]|jgi:hypothetical protein